MSPTSKRNAIGRCPTGVSHNCLGGAGSTTRSDALSSRRQMACHLESLLFQVAPIRRPSPLPSHRGTLCWLVLRWHALIVPVFCPPSSSRSPLFVISCDQRGGDDSRSRLLSVVKRLARTVSYGHATPFVRLTVGRGLGMFLQRLSIGELRRNADINGFGPWRAP